MIELITEKPAWYTILCILLGVAYAFALYYKDQSIPSEGRWLKRGLAAGRALLVSLLAFLLLTPLIKSFSREVEKPIVILAQDNSESIVAGSDSAAIRKNYTEQFNGLANRLRSKYDVKIISWGDHVDEASSFAFDEKITDFSGMLEELDVRYGNRNVGAVVIATDGLYNRGSNPLYNTSLMKVPFYSVAMGDTVVRKDVRIGRINFNKTVYLGNSFPVEVSVEARQAAGAQVTLTVQEDSSVLFSRPVNISNNRFSQVVTVLLDAAKKGNHHYTFKVSSIPAEITLVNNVKDIYVEVKETKEKILLLAHAPHPDVAALKQSIESSRNYEAVPVMMDRFDGKTDGYNLVILHSLPSGRYPVQDLAGRLKAAGIPVLYILGSESSLGVFNKSDAGVTITNSLQKTNASTATFNNDFSLFTLSDETRKMIPQLPPLHVPFGEYRTSAGSYTLLFQQIGTVETRAPLLLFAEDKEYKTAVLAGEGYWRWRLGDYAANGNFSASQELILKTIQFLSNKEQKSRFRLNSKTSVPENEPLLFDATVYNENYELINTPDVNMVITSRDKKSFPYTFSKTDKAYTLNAGYFQPGEYTFKASVNAGGKSFSQDGAFHVVALQQELTETTANHDLLYSMAQKSGGRVFAPSQMEALGDSLLKRELKPVSYSNYKLRDLINLKWVFFVLLALLSMEWFARKRSGAY